MSGNIQLFKSRLGLVFAHIVPFSMMSCQQHMNSYLWTCLNRDEDVGKGEGHYIDLKQYRWEGTSQTIIQNEIFIFSWIPTMVSMIWATTPTWYVVYSSGNKRNKRRFHAPTHKSSFRWCTPKVQKTKSSKDQKTKSSKDQKTKRWA